MTSRSALSRHAALASGLSITAVLLQPRPAGGDCRVTIVPIGADSTWRQASTEAMRHIETLPVETRDCRDVLVEVHDRGALVTMTIRDGRLARRLIVSPADLTPTLSALMTTVGTTPDQTLREEVREPPPTSSQVTVPTKDVVVAAAPGAAQNPGHVAVGGAVGARLGTPNRVVGPVFQVTAGLAMVHWEVGVFAELEPLHSSSFEVPRGFSMWSAGGGVVAGARIPAGAFAFVTGARLGAGIVSETAEGEADAKDVGEQNVGGAVAEPRAGLYGGAVWPARSRVRLRSQLMLDATPTRLGATRTIDAGLPPLPAWSWTLQVGVEGEVL